MNGRRALGLGLVIICDGVLFFFAAKELLDSSEELFWRVLAMAVCAGVLGGIVFEIGKCKAARTLNVGVPVVVGAVLASSFMWLPIVAKIQHWPPITVEPAYLLVFSLLPFFLACVVELAYRLINTSPDSTVARR
jgi:drug/metabolite transporter (DMT)-like permease